MPRRPRHDAPDTWHHVMNRGIARRPIFETDEDRRFFLSLLAREVRAGRIEVHAFCLMLTHFHLLVRSVTGQLSEAMRRIQNRYSRWFNRTRKRDGPLVKGRFLSCLVDTLRYRRRVVTYIHDNPLEARVCSDPTRHEWSSASHFARSNRPRWLETSWIDSELEARGGGGALASQLAHAFPSRLDDEFRRSIERSLCARLPDELEDVTLKHAGSPRVVRWAMRKAKLADGTRPWQPVCLPKAVEGVIARVRERVGPVLGLFKRKTKDAWIVLRAGLLRLLSGCTHREIGMRVDRHSATISRDVHDHTRLVATDAAYATLAARVAHAAMQRAS
jgi:REP element-mobilizing transposase RayT